jgi:hypothetical protein
MFDVAWIILPAGFVLAATGLVVWRTRRRDQEPILYVRQGQVRVVANVDAPNRNLSETLPRRSRAIAEADRHFYGYERVRAPRYMPDFDQEQTDVLRPVQVIRVGSQAEREEIERQIPPHLKVIFLEEDAAPPAVATEPLSHK